MPVWTYGIQLWGSASKSTIQTIQKFQNKALSIIMDVPWYLQRDMGIDPSKLIEDIAADRRLLRIRLLDLINSDF